MKIVFDEMMMLLLLTVSNIPGAVLAIRCLGYSS